MPKFKISALANILLLTGALMGCSKHAVTPTPVPPVDTATTYHDPAQYGTPFSGVPATNDMVIYEVNIQTCTPATFQGVTARLDSIKALGVSVIWLMPTYPIGVLKSVGSPYCVKDNEGVNAGFGTLTDLRNLVAQAHSLGMAVIMDWEANDTSWDNAWITSHPSWYVQNGAGAIQQLSSYTDVAALNFNNVSMRIAMIRAMKYWVFAANVDGYRCDFADNPPTDFWTQALDTLNHITTHKLIYLAEGTKGSEITSGFQIGYAFSYYATLKALYAGTATLADLFATNTTELASLPSPGVKLRYITNHDDASSDGSTITEYKGQAGAISAFVLAAYMDGIPLVYDSQEVGYPNAINFFNTVPVDYNSNPAMVAAYKNILAFRAAHAAIKTGALTPYPDPTVVAFEKKSGADDVLVIVNPTGNTVNYSVPTAIQGTWASAFQPAYLVLSSQLSLQPYAAIVLKKN